MRLKLYRGWWYVVWREGAETRRRALRTQDRDAAARALADYEKLRAQPTDTIAQVFAAYEAEKGKERATWAWKKLKGTFGHLRPDQVTAKLCKDYVKRRRADHYRPGVETGLGTIHTELTFLRAALNWHRPGAGLLVDMPPKPGPKKDYLTREQFAGLLEAAKVPHIRLFIMLALGTAGRMGAILDLTWDRVDFDRGIVQLSHGPQTKKGRATVPMNASLRAVLEEAYQARGTSNFVVEYGGGKVAKVRKGFASVAKTAGVPWATPHVLRHTAAVWMAEHGTSMAEIAQFLGHSDERTTFRVYAIYSPGHLAKAAAALEV